MKNFREYLIESLNVLSLKSDAQLAYLDEIGVPGIIDELAKVCLKALSSR
jgi:hypothetical protein